MARRFSGALSNFGQRLSLKPKIEVHTVVDDSVPIGQVYVQYLKKDEKRIEEVINTSSFSNHVSRVLLVLGLSEYGLGALALMRAIYSKGMQAAGEEWMKKKKLRDTQTQAQAEAETAECCKFTWMDRMKLSEIHMAVVRGGGRGGGGGGSGSTSGSDSE